MPTIRAQVAWRHTSGLAQDRTINTFHFSALLADPTTTAAIIAALDSFYLDVHSPGTLSIESFLGSQLTGVADVKLYDLSDAEPRVPIAEDVIEGAQNTVNSLPAEVAFVLSFQGEKLSGVPQARRRGRVYIGPLITATASVFSDGPVPRPGLSLRNACLGAGSQLIIDSAAANAPWCVYSRANDAVAVVTDGWIDNAFDTQRRRGEDATLRTTFT